MKPTVGLVLGDPCGVGPEVAAKLLAQPEIYDAARVVLVADASVFRDGQSVAGVEVPVVEMSPSDIGSEDLGRPMLVDAGLGPDFTYTPGQATAEGGRYVLATFKKALDLAQNGTVDSVCYAPLNKQAMSLGGSPFPDEVHWIANEIDHQGPMVDCTFLDGLWTARATSHVPIAEVSQNLSQERVIEVAEVIDATLRGVGIAEPKIAVSALNPHAGDGGLIGREEIEVLSPAVERLRAAGLAVEGPFSPDTVFLRGRDGDYDAVVTMYHDQGQIALKLLGFGRAVSVIGGISVPVATPAQGTAFDIVGQGKASAEGMNAAFRVACDMGRARRAA